MIRYREHPMVIYIGLFCLGILSGVLFIRLSGHGAKSHLILCSEYFLYQYAYETVEYRELLFYVLINRVPLFLILLVASLSKYKKRITGGGLCVCSFGMTYLIGVTMLRYGLRALALVIGLMTPQIIFYTQSVHLLLRKKSPVPWKSYGWGGIFFILGLLAEVYVNPRWLRFLLELF